MGFWLLYWETLKFRPEMKVLKLLWKSGTESSKSDICVCKEWIFILTDADIVHLAVTQNLSKHIHITNTSLPIPYQFQQALSSSTGNIIICERENLLQYCLRIPYVSIWGFKMCCRGNYVLLKFLIPFHVGLPYFVWCSIQYTTDSFFPA